MKPAKLLGLLVLLVGLYLALNGGTNEPSTPAPIPEKGFRFLLVEETADRTRELTELINDPAFRDFLDANCVKVNGVPEWRKLDKDQRLTGASDVWKNAMKRALSSPGFKVPWVVVSNGVSGFEGPLPKMKTDELLEFLRPFVPKK